MEPNTTASDSGDKAKVVLLTTFVILVVNYISTFQRV
jgi:hypothetical protein